MSCPGPGSGIPDHEFQKRQQEAQLPPDILCEGCGKGKAVNVSDFEPYIYLCQKCDEAINAQVAAQIPEALCEICHKRTALYRPGTENAHPWTCAKCDDELREMK